METRARTKYRSKYLAVILFLIPAAGLCAQLPVPGYDDKAAFTVLSIKDGLPNASVSGLIQDSKGFIWMSTQGGLCRYDGSGFKVYENQPFNENSISGDLIQTIFRDRDDVLWLGTYSGLNRFDPETEEFRRYRYSTDSETSLSNDLVIAVARDSQGRLWVGTLNGLNRLDEATGTFKRYHHDDGDPRSVPNNVIRCLFLDSRGRLWVGTTGGGLALYDYATDSFENRASMSMAPGPASPGPGREEVKGFPSSASVQGISEAADGALWVGAWGTGLVRYLPDEGSSTIYRLPDNKLYVVNAREEGKVYAGTWGGGLYVLETASGGILPYKTSLAVGAIPNDVIYSILIDASKELWVGTNGGGIAKLDRTRRSFSAYVFDPSNDTSLPNGKVIASLRDSRGRLWASVYGTGIHLLDEATGRWRHFSHREGDPSSLGDNICNLVYEDSKGSIWACTNVGLSLLDERTMTFRTWRPVEGDPGSLASGIIYAILEDPKGNFWVGTYTAGLEYWDRQTGIFKHYPFSSGNPGSISDNLVTSLAYDAEGRLWVGTNNGLNRFEGGSFVHYAYDPVNTDGLASSSILKIFVDSLGVMWIGTRGGGLNRYDPETDSFRHFMRKDGLPSNIVYAILEDAMGDLWIVTQTGLACYDRPNASLRRITLYKELENASFTSGSSSGPGGEFYFGSVGMLVRFVPSRYDRNTHVPPVYITDLKAANLSKIPAPTSTGGGRRIALTNWENSIELRFAALDYRDPQSNQFAYKLEGFDKEWNYSSTRNFATYTNLPGGRYVFRVKASNNDGIWNEAGAALPFSIASPPFLSPVALGLYLLALILVGYALASLRANQLLAQKVKALTVAEKALTAANAEARRLAEAADDANEAKSEFIATVTHEIRTPIHGVVGMAEILARSNLDPEQAYEVETIRKSGESLLGLVNDVLDFAKIEARKVRIEEVAFDLAGLMAETGEFFAPPAAAKGLSFDLSVDPALPRVVRGDPLRLRQILYNLAGNAVKFTEQGGVRIGAEAAETGVDQAGSAAIRFSVADTGIGIAEDRQEELFRPFMQADRSTTRRFGGTGLGLSISKNYVELMGGRLELRSEEGHGSTFSFTLVLPLAPESELAAGPDAAAAGFSMKGLEVLVVDDDIVNRRIASRFLSELGARPSESGSSMEALEALGKRGFDLVLVDCMMPVMDGYELTRRIRSGDGARGSLVLDPAVPVIAMTAKALPEDRLQCLDAGMDECLVKPFSMRMLNETISRILSSRVNSPHRAPGPARAVLPEDATGAQVSYAACPVFERKDFDAHYRSSPALAHEILELFLQQTRPLYESALASGRRGNWDEVVDAMHRMKGCSGAIDAARLVKLSEAIHDAAKAAMKDGRSGPGRDIEVLFADFGSSLTELESILRAYLEDLPQGLEG